MQSAVVLERDSVFVLRLPPAVEEDLGDTSADASGVLDRDLVTRRVIPKRRLESGPGARDARVYAERRLLHAQTEDPFHGGSIHPARRSRVPRPAAAAHVGGFRTDVAGGDVGLRHVPVQTGG